MLDILPHGPNTLAASAPLSDSRSFGRPAQARTSLVPRSGRRPAETGTRTVPGTPRPRRRASRSGRGRAPPLRATSRGQLLRFLFLVDALEHFAASDGLSVNDA